ncbi:MAG: aspartate carbamoyltransferase catalytic subunit [Deltaproteobacteria bacterium]|nr:aspartate carbamoyltransferase catalytic subunit [Deltaproteobacteria bacterium]
MSFARKDLLAIEPLSAEEIVSILDTAEGFAEVSRRDVKKVPTLRGKTVVNLFFEASTRTRVSFEIAEKRLSADSVNFSSSGSSVSKGETLLDTVKNIEAMAPDILVIRHSAAGAAEFVAQRTKAAVVNAGDGRHEHPTQALLDLFTVRKHKGRIAGLTLAIVGDILNSRVARSDIHAFTKLGAKVRVCGPPTMLPPQAERMGVTATSRIEEAVEGADVVMALRIQKERLGKASFPSIREYARFFGLNEEVLEGAAPDAIVMHPGPINRGVEIASELADGARSVILDQVESGVAVRMAVIYLLSGGGRSEWVS